MPDGKVVIDLGTEKAATRFAEWLCEQGEQNYWDWMDESEREDDDDITAIEFKYDYKNANIVGKMGRLS
jgi:hypothetical protein